MWIQERETDREREHKKGGREEHVDCLEDFWPFYLKSDFTGDSLAFYMKNRNDTTLHIYLKMTILH